jgi:hypothetical protein
LLIAASLQEFRQLGDGAWHAKSRLMQAGYVNTAHFAPALAAIFVAKKAAEVAPGVGTATDIHIVFKNQVEPLRPDLAAKLSELYNIYEDRTSCFGAEHYKGSADLIETLGDKDLQSEQGTRSTAKQNQAEETMTASQTDIVATESQAKLWQAWKR